MTDSEIKDFLEEKHDRYNTPDFINTDPIQIPHSFSLKEDIEISGFLTSSIAWGKRSMIIKNAEKMMSVLDRAPFDFIKNATEKEIQQTYKFVHRTFNTFDFQFFLSSLKHIYSTQGGLEKVFSEGYKTEHSVKAALKHFRKIFLEHPHLKRSEKHIADVNKWSAAKRINLFLMWMIRNDKRKVHFGLWKKIPISKLMIPLDIHSGNTARNLGLLKRKQNDWKSVEILTEKLRSFDPNDPIKYDFSLFGLGVFEGFNK